VSLRRSVVATAIYIANWWQLSGPGSYWQAFGTPAPLNHTWSLAIEEQFYVIWPIIALIVWKVAKRPARALPALAVVAISVDRRQWLLFKPGPTGRVPRHRHSGGLDPRRLRAAIALWTRSHRGNPRSGTGSTCWRRSPSSASWSCGSSAGRASGSTTAASHSWPSAPR
jgi:hypothetical protein